MNLIIKSQGIKELKNTIKQYENKVVSLYSVEFAEKELSVSINDFCIEYGLNKDRITKIVDGFSEMNMIKLYSDKFQDKEVL